MYFTNWLELEDFKDLIQQPLKDFGIGLELITEPNNDGYIFKLVHHDDPEISVITIEINDNLDVDYEIMPLPAVKWLLSHILYSLSKNEFCRSYDQECPGTFIDYAKENSINYNVNVSPSGFTIPGVREILSHLN